TFASVDDYIASFPSDVQQTLGEIRRTMHAVVPDAGEAISYGIPTITLEGRALVYFAGWKRHVSVYPVPDGDEDYSATVAPFRSGASTVKFPLTAPIPYDVIGLITSRLREQHRA